MSLFAYWFGGGCYHPWTPWSSIAPSPCRGRLRPPRSSSILCWASRRKQGWGGWGWPRDGVWWRMEDGGQSLMQLSLICGCSLCSCDGCIKPDVSHWMMSFNFWQAHKLTSLGGKAKSTGFLPPISLTPSLTAQLPLALYQIPQAEEWQEFSSFDLD